jgi:hypothetical protein
MEISSVLARQGQRLLQIGIGLLLFSALEGFAIPHLGSPRISATTGLAWLGLVLWGLRMDSVRP